MAKAGYTAAAAATVLLTAATAKSVIGFVAPAQFGGDWTGYELSFDGAVSTAVPVTVELCRSTFATNGPGTNSTAITITQEYGRTIAAGFTAASNWTTEPTVLTVFHAFTVAAYNGLVIVKTPPPQTPDCDVSTGFVIRCNAPAGVNCRPTVSFERC